ncbi:Ku protein [Streptomyces graminofaciens]|uniref:Ku protein n=1 Tax=Streptomyces graminofaciens TaxID=68212 RepID=UPI003305D4AC
MPGREVSAEDIVKGFEVTEGEYVVVEPEELDDRAGPLPGHRYQRLRIATFVELEAVPQRRAGARAGF